MSVLTNFLNKVKLRTSHWVVPSHRAAVRHVTTDNFEILVFANEDVGRLIWLNKSFEAAESRLFKLSIRPEDICLDVGGNVGYFSLLMANRASRGRTHIFEPIPRNAAMIRANLLLNGFSNASVNEVALSSEVGEVQFSVSIDSAYSSMRPTGTSAEAQNITVKTVTLDCYLDEQKIERVDVLKIDVEGAEDLVLQGAEQLFSDRLRRPRLVMLELHDANLAPYRTTVGDVMARMSGWAYTAKVVRESGDALIPYDPSQHRDVYNIFFEPR